jgi:hypothetical protein
VNEVQSFCDPSMKVQSFCDQVDEVQSVSASNDADSRQNTATFFQFLRSN